MEFVCFLQDSLYGTVGIALIPLRGGEAQLHGKFEVQSGEKPSGQGLAVMNVQGSDLPYAA